MMKRFLYLAAALLLGLAVSCEKNKQPEKLDVTGIWELASVTTKASVGSVNVSVYVEFSAGGSFVLYQQIGSGRYTRFDGTYRIGEDNTLSGSYSGGKSWGPYQATLSETSLVLTTSAGSEKDTYKKIGAIPDSVLQNIY